MNDLWEMAKNNCKAQLTALDQEQRQHQRRGAVPGIASGGAKCHQLEGSTDEVEARFPRLGKIRKGGEKTSSGFGPDLDHFRFVPDQGRPEIGEVFEEVFGKEPRAINVYIPYATPEEAFPTWAEIWGKTGLVHRCDGVHMTVWQEGGKYQRGTKPCPGGHKNNDYLQDAVGRLHMVIPELIEAGYVGYVTLETHSKNDIVGILSTLHAVYEARKSNELGLRGVMFTLRRAKESISTPGFGKQAGARSRVDKWLVRLEPAADWMRLQIEMAHASAMQLEPGERSALLPSGLEADLVTGEIIEGEIMDAREVHAQPEPEPEQTPLRPAEEPTDAAWPGYPYPVLDPFQRAQAGPQDRRLAHQRRPDC